MNELIIPEEFTNKNIEKFKDLFEPQIRMRGEQYYRNGNVQTVYKVAGKNSYVAKVEGQEEYTTIIEMSDDGGLQMSCSCPYWNNCKHEWATLLTIAKGDYKEINMRPVVDKQDIPMTELIKKIPAGKLKKYLVKMCEDRHFEIDYDELEDEFFEYLPRNDYDFYYNKLYNAIEMGGSYNFIINQYLYGIKRYISIKEYEVAFEIIKAMLELSHDKEIDITDKMPQIGMLLRICYNKTKEDKEQLKYNKEMKMYINKLKRENYYDNVYIEDMISTISLK